MRDFFKTKYSTPAFLLAFIFGGAIIGENVSLSLIVSTLGSTIIGNLYLLNGVLLLGLPLIFFRYIDKVDRGKLLTNLILVTALVLSLILSLMILCSIFNVKWFSGILITLYPVSYLSKTILFLTFWTFSNDIFDTSESKNAFPVIAAWGFAGGLVGACFARILLELVSAEMVIALWALAYIVAYFISRKMRIVFKHKLVPKEELHSSGMLPGIKGDIGNVLALKLVRYMAILYFFIFLAIFSFDYLFWQKCHLWFRTSESIASFQFSFYLAHGIVTIAGLRYLLPLLIARVGFTRILYVLPLTLMTGALILAVLKSITTQQGHFIWFTSVQFFRYITFEIAFSPIYQMFFASIDKEIRGRAKTFLEGFIKPGAMIASGLILIALRNNPLIISVLVLSCSLILVLVAFYIRRTYVLSLIPDSHEQLEPQKLFARLSNLGDDQRLMELIDQYSKSDDVDMRIISVKLLAGLGSNQALQNLISVYNSEGSVRVKENIARSLEGFYGYNSRSFFEMLLREPNPRIRANALYSLNKMFCHWKIHFKPSVRLLLFDSSIRVQIEAACFLWELGDEQEKINVNLFLDSLLGSVNVNRRAAGVYLTGMLQIPSWEQILLENLKSSLIQVFTKSVEMLLRYAPSDTRIHTLRIIENLDREHISIAGRVIEDTGAQLWPEIVEFLSGAKNRRMVFEMVKSLRTIADSIRSSGKTWHISNNTAAIINEWILKELESVYKGAIELYNLQIEHKFADYRILEDSLRDNIIRFCEWAVSAMVLLDKRGILIWKHNDIDIRERAQRLDLIEIIESTSYQKIGTLVLPLLKDESWETMAKIGKNHFHYTEKDREPGLNYFLKSDNRWIILCTMYTISRSGKPDASKLGILRMLSDDQNKLVSETAEELVEADDESQLKKIRAFELLERVLFLKKTVLFKNVSAEKLMRLAEIAHEATYMKDTLISAQGEISDILYIVKKGSLRVIKTVDSVSTVLRRVKSGDTYGEIGLFTQSPRSASALADEQCELLIIRRGVFKKLLLEIPDIAVSLLEVLCERLKKRGDTVLDLKKQLTCNDLSDSDLNAEEFFT
ncbi:MAG TPA: cyclic nucleotide-binding domain-containing protein [Chitinispirillaceae bacterium]|nr:cyclic nucleotide-binding domain-containing protein [Chitinispirillaceae bacterium]